MRVDELTNTLGRNIFSRRAIEFEGDDEKEEEKLGKEDFEASKETVGGS